MKIIEPHKNASDWSTTIICHYCGATLSINALDLKCKYHNQYAKYFTVLNEYKDFYFECVSCYVSNVINTLPGLVQDYVISKYPPPVQEKKLNWFQKLFSINNSDKITTDY